MDETCTQCTSQNMPQSPVCCGTTTAATYSNTPVNGVVSATDQGGKPITFSLSVPPSNGAVAVNFETGVWSYTPHPDFVGTDSFAVSAANTDCVACVTTITIYVEAQYPQCCEHPPITLLAGEEATGCLHVFDPQHQLILYSVAAQSVNGTLLLNTVTGEWSYCANDGFVGNDNFCLMATNQSGLSCSTVIHLQVVRVNATLCKTASTHQVCVGCPFSYTITATNTGTFPMEDCIIIDQLPPQLEVVSLVLDGTPINGNLGMGLHIGSLEPGECATLVVTVKVLRVAALPCPFQNTAQGQFMASPNPCQPPITICCTAMDCPGITVQSPQLTLIKSVNQTSAAVGETVLYSILVKNDGNVVFSNVLVLDSLDTNLAFQAGTLHINGHPVPLGSLISGVSIPRLAVGESALITFDALIIAQGSGTLQNQAVATFDYEACQGNALTSGSVRSNLVVLTVKNPSLLLKKSADKNLAVLGETLRYTVTIQNNGDVDAHSVIFKDALPATVKLVDGTFTVDGVQINGVNLADGVFLGNIPVKKTVIIQYQVRVVSIDCKGLIINKVIANFGYATSQCGPIKRMDTTATSSETHLAISLFKQLNVKSDLMVQECKPDIEQINSVTGKVETTECYVVETPVGESREGQKLTGYKLIFHGMLNLTVEYTADVAEQKVHSELYYVPFSSFVVMQPDFNSNYQITLKATVEDIYFRQMSNRRFFTNATLLVIVNTR